MTRKPAILAAAVAATISALAAPAASAQARTGAGAATETRTGAASAGKAEIRYAWVKSCPQKKRDYDVPCGPWKLVMRDGSTRTLGDARVHPRTSDGKVDKELTAPLSVSGDGRHVAYFRESDGKLVVRDVAANRVRVLPGAAARPPKGIGMNDVDITISDDGGRVVLDYEDARMKLSTLLVDLGTGKISKVSPKLSIQGFSHDGGHILATRYTGENTTELSVLDENGATTGRRVVPQVIANNMPQALADDGNTVAVLITTSSGRQRLRVYDLDADNVGAAVDVKVPKNESPHDLAWDDSGALTLWELRSDNDGNTTGAVRRSLDPASGATRTLDAFKVGGKIYVWWLPGE
ncbi:hypothetical protein [Microtetraspora niveoalba]|uniref:hypothetical protein n=1 Tax=Microtetraspora niveoalba TaxID=46175 RepID=UPI00082C9A30|nr:hypothetical protein [Microtetraspora niveoalba]